MKQLNIIGCGVVGSVLGRLWHECSVFEIGRILNRSSRSGEEAVRFIGAGVAVSTYEQLGNADLTFIATGDSEIEECCERLAASRSDWNGKSVFHPSGMLSSEALQAVKVKGGSVASIHPVQTFPNPELGFQAFRGTFVTCEGDKFAREQLRDAIVRIGGQYLEILPSHKLLYHSAIVFACNYLTALLETSLRILSECEVPRDIALPLLIPIVRQTVKNIGAVDTANALSGPIARGDIDIVKSQYETVTRWDKNAGALYRELGKITCELAQQKGKASPQSINKIKELFGDA